MRKLYSTLCLIYFSFLSLAQSNQTAVNKNESINREAKVLFANSVTKLTDAEKNEICNALGAKLNKDGKTFSAKQKPEHLHLTASVYPLDLNNDGTEEVYIIFNENNPKSQAGSQHLFIKVYNGNYALRISEGINALSYIIGRNSSSYPDIYFQDSGYSVVYRWDKQYEIYDAIGYDSVTYNSAKGVLLKDLSGKYIANPKDNSSFNVEENINNSNKEKEAIKQSAIAFYRWHENVWEKTPLFKMVLNQKGQHVEDENECPCTIDWNVTQQYFDWMKKNAPLVSKKYLDEYKAKMPEVEKQMKNAKTFPEKMEAVENFYAAGYHFFEGNAGAPKFSQSNIFNGDAIWNINIKNDGTAEVNTTFKFPKDWNSKTGDYALQMIKENGNWKLAAQVKEGEIQKINNSNVNQGSTSQQNSNSVSDPSSSGSTYSKKPLGGKTQYELGKLLLKALQTDDKDLWLSCIHPDAKKDMGDMVSKAFEEFREKFAGQGIENWNLVEYSRTTFNARDMMGHSEGMHGNKTVWSLKVEFYYNHKAFIGGFNLGAAETYKDGNWFIITPGFRRTIFIRNSFK